MDANQPNAWHRDFDLDVCDDVRLAIQAGDVQTLRSLIDTRFGVHPQRHTLSLYQAINQGSVEMVKMLLDAGIDRYYYGDSDQFGLPEEPRISPLYRAIDIENRELRWKMVRLLVESGLSPKKEHLYHESCMCAAANQGDLELVRFLFDAGAEVNTAREITMPPEWTLDGNYYTYKEYSPLHVAIRELDGEVRVKMVELLIEMGSDVNAIRWIPGEACLHMLSHKKAGNQEVFKLLIGADADLNCLTGSGSTPLAIAALHGDIELMKLMIAAGADINLFDNDISSPLYFAVCGFDRDAVQLLLENGADPNATDQEGDNILCWAAKFHEGKSKKEEYIDILTMLFAYGAENHYASIKRHVPFRTLLATGTIEAMNVFFENGVTLANCGVSHLLHHSAQNPRKDILAYLLKSNRYDVDELMYENEHCNTPLFTAVLNQRHQNVQLLIEWGADVNIPYVNQVGNHTECSFTFPLFGAVCRGNGKIVDLLLSAGANANADDGSGICQHTLDKVREPKFRKILNSLVGEVALLKSQACSNQDNENFSLQKFANLSPEIERNSVAELEMLKSIAFYGSLSLYDLLRGKDVARYIKNKHVVRNFESLRLVEYFPIYGNRIKITYSLAKARRKVIDRAMMSLNKMLGSHFCHYHEILWMIISHLRLKDLCNLCNV